MLIHCTVHTTHYTHKTPSDLDLIFENIINFTELGVADIHSDYVGSDKKGFTLQLLLYTAPVASIK